MAPIRNTLLFALLASTALAQDSGSAANRWRTKTVTVTQTVTVTAANGQTAAATTTKAIASPHVNGNGTGIATANVLDSATAPAKDETMAENLGQDFDGSARTPTDGQVPKADGQQPEGQQSQQSQPEGQTNTPSTNSAPVPSATDASATTSGTAPTETGSSNTTTTPPAQGNGNGKNDVFAHYLFGIIPDHTADDWAKDIASAQSYGVSAFALNIGANDAHTDKQLELAYAAAEKAGFKLFISFDFAAGFKDDSSKVAEFIKNWGKHAAHYAVDGKPMFSSFISDGFDWSAAAQSAGMDIYAIPMTSSTNAGDFKGASGIFSWEAWASANNEPVDKPVSLATDARFFSAAESDKLDYMMPVSPWFFTHYGHEVSYPKNYLFPAEDQWLNRWDQALQASDKTRFLEILTWNDFGESSYLVDPATVQATDDGHAKWTKGFNHAALMDLAKPYISAFQSGAKQPVVDKDTAVWWYRPHLKGAECDATDSTGKPKGWDLVSDTVFVAVITKNGGTLTVTSGSNAPVTQQVEAGIKMVKVPMGTGAQSFELKTTDGNTLSGKGAHEVSADCVNGIYNFNIEVGALA